jgi:subtilisin family serine protease
MSGSDENNDKDVSRRTFMKGVGTLVGASALGAGMTTDVTAAAGDLDPRFLNWRTVEAKKVWDRGYRGRVDRTIGLTDSGIDARHPEVGPWNGAKAEVRQNRLVIPTSDSAEQEKSELTDGKGNQKGEEFSGTILPGTVVGPTQQRQFHEFVTPADAENIEAAMTGSPNGPDGLGTDNELYLEKAVYGDGGGIDHWRRVATSTNPGSEEQIDSYVEDEHDYRFVVESWISGPYNYTIQAGYFTLEGELNALTGEDAREAWIQGNTEAGVTGVTGDLTPETPKVVGWNGSHDEPLDGNGHGSHVSGIMAGSGRGSTIDDVTVHEPRDVLAPTDFREYEVSAEVGTNVFASAFGDNVELYIVGPDGRELHHTAMQQDSIVADEPTRDDAYHPNGGTATYTIRVKPVETRSATEDTAGRAQAGNPTAGRLDRIAVGAYEDQFSTVGERTDDETDVPDASLLGRSMHPGIAPNQSIVGVQGLSDATRLVGQYAGDFSDIFHLRAVNMSWGWVGGAPLGVAGGETDSGVTAAIKSMAQGGILPVSAAGNSFTPANTGSPATADEAISVVATGPLDGITSYSSGGVAALDEDENRVYGKPDVTAPGGDAEPDGAGNIAMSIVENQVQGATGVDVPLSYPVPSRLELVRSVQAGDPDTDLPDDEPRDYDDAGGTSMASPYVCGVACLVAQAMEEDAPDGVALPEPQQTNFDDVMRLKQVILATASETAFTAAPYHSAKNVPNAPTYDFGGRDPYEGFGRVNPDAAVDAVTRPLVADADAVSGDPAVDAGSVAPDTSETAALQETVGLDLPEDSRAVAGYLSLDGGEVDISVDFTHYSGGNKGMAKGTPHVDLFVYDAQSPATGGEPNDVASAQGLEGGPGVTVSGAGTYFVVAKLVNVPGAVNGFHITAHVDLTVTYTAPPVPALSADGTRSDSDGPFTAGSTIRVVVEPDHISEEVPDETVVTVRDDAHADWHVYEDADVVRVEDNNRVVLAPGGEGDVTAADVRDGNLTLTYYAEAPEQTGQHEFGPSSLEIPDEVEGRSGTRATFGGTDDNVVVGVDQNSPTDSATTDATTDSDDGRSTAEGATDAVSGTTDTVDDSL